MLLVTLPLEDKARSTYGTKSPHLSRPTRSAAVWRVPERARAPLVHLPSERTPPSTPRRVCLDVLCAAHQHALGAGGVILRHRSNYGWGLRLTSPTLTRSIEHNIENARRPESGPPTQTHPKTGAFPHTEDVSAHRRTDGRQGMAGVVRVCTACAYRDTLARRGHVWVYF